MHSAFTHYSLQDPVSTNHTTRANRLLSPIVLHRRPRRRAVQQTGLRCTPTQHSRSAYNASLCLRENAAGILRCAAVAETRPQNFIAISDLPPLDPAAVPNVKHVKRSEPNALLSPQHPRFREPEQATNAAAPTANARRTCSPPTSRTCGSATSRRACTDCCTDGSRSPPLLCFSFPLFSPLIFKRSAGRSPARRRRSA